MSLWNWRASQKKRDQEGLDAVAARLNAAAEGLVAGRLTTQRDLNRLAREVETVSKAVDRNAQEDPVGVAALTRMQERQGTPAGREMAIADRVIAQEARSPNLPPAKTPPAMQTIRDIGTAARKEGLSSVAGQAAVAEKVLPRTNDPYAQRLAADLEAHKAAAREALRRGDERTFKKETALGGSAAARLNQRLTVTGFLQNARAAAAVLKGAAARPTSGRV